MIKIFADTADYDTIIELNNDPKISGFTTNPTLMKKAGVSDYEQYCKNILQIVKNKPISFEVFADDFDEMERQAKIISSWEENIYVKIPITNTQKEYSTKLFKNLISAKIKINVTGVMLPSQVRWVSYLLGYEVRSIISVFAGRISDTGRSAKKIMKECVGILGETNNQSQELLWASSRELYNIVQAEESGANIITVTSDLLKKMEKTWGKNLEDFSLETVQLFYNDAQKAGYQL